MKRAINIVATVAHALIFALGIFLSVTANAGISGVTEGQSMLSGFEILGAVLGSAVMTVVYFLAVGYTIFAFIPFLLKFIGIFTGGGVSSIFCAIFSAFFIFLNIMLALSTVGTINMFFIIASIVSVFTLVLNVTSYVII